MTRPRIEGSDITQCWKSSAEFLHFRKTWLIKTTTTNNKDNNISNKLDFRSELERRGKLEE